MSSLDACTQYIQKSTGIHRVSPLWKQTKLFRNVHEEYEDIFFLHTCRDYDVFMSGDGGHESAAAGRGAARHPVPGHGGGPGQPRPGGRRGVPP